MTDTKADEGAEVSNEPAKPELSWEEREKLFVHAMMFSDASNIHSSSEFKKKYEQQGKREN